MEHKGLVSRVEEDLERTIALGRCPQGTLPSERVMARRYGVSRTTIRGALQGLTARGLIVKHPGRQSRTVALDQALTLESLKLALPEDGRDDPDRRRLLEGFFALKREVTVELLAACCEHASREELDELGGACFALREEAHWKEDRRGWVCQEFALLRLAARAADRPGHALLIQSLEKAFRGLSDRILPHLDAGAIEQWALFALHALHERDAQALRHELPTLLKTVDARLLEHLAPVHEARRPPAPGSSHPADKELLSGAALPNRSACHTSSDQPLPAGGLPVQAGPPHSDPCSGSGAPPGPSASPSPSEFQCSSSNLDEVPAPPPRVPADTAWLHGSPLPPTLFMALAPPVPLAEDGLETAEPQHPVEASRTIPLARLPEGDGG